MSDKENTIVVYGTVWCPSSMWARRILDRHDISYRWVNIDRDPEGQAYVEQVNNGFRSVPTIVFPDGSVLVEPTKSELVLKLGLELDPTSHRKIGETDKWLESMKQS